MGKNNNTRKYKPKQRKTKRKRGGKVRVEEIHYSLGRQHTNPDIKGVIRVKSGPTTYEAASRGEYISNFFSDVAKSFEEDIALMINGEPKSRTKKKVFTFEYNDNDAPLAKGSDKPVEQCEKKSNKKDKKDKKEKTEKK